MNLESLIDESSLGEKLRPFSEATRESVRQLLRAPQVSFQESARPVLRPTATPTQRAAGALLNPGLLPSSQPLSKNARTALQTSAPLAPALPNPHARFLPIFTDLSRAIRSELSGNLSKLLTLNTSRKEAAAQHLDRLAGQGRTPGSLSPSGLPDAACGLRRWIDGPRTPAQDTALEAFFEEFARVYLGQALLLKAWSDRGVRPWKKEDLSSLNWALTQALKPHVPVDREGWQLTRNLYSWYIPSSVVQTRVWEALENWRFGEEGPDFLSVLLRSINDRASVYGTGYDERFFSAIWDRLATLVPPSAPDAIKRRKLVFSPTLRDGAMVRTGPTHLGWIGLEQHPFNLLVAELIQLWWGPSAPPIWAQGSGLEVHSKDQIALALSSPKPSLISRMQEVESCDVGFVLEERILRMNGRTAEAARTRELVESISYFKKIKGLATSLGGLQAVVAITKLRPGGFLWWAREEPLTANDGEETLSFLLDRAQLIAEWDLSAVGHSLPGMRALFPKYIYLWRRDPDLTSRAGHRPIRVTASGQIRSHVELPMLLADTLAMKPITRETWEVHAHTSPSAQREWAKRWPDPACFDALREIESLKKEGAPLAGLATIRTAPAGDPDRGGAWTVVPGARGLWIRAETENGVRRLHTEILPEPRAGETRELTGQGFLALVPDESISAPLAAYLESESVNRWLEHTCERKNDRWVLNEQIVRFIPIPKLILEALGLSAEGQARDEGSFATPLPGDWERLASSIAIEPRAALDRLSTLARDPEGRRLRSALFVRAARAELQLKRATEKLLEVVTNDGGVRWGKLLSILPRSECVQVTLHSSVRIVGILPAMVAIAKVERVQSPEPGFLLATENGMSVRLVCDDPRLRDMLDDQLKSLEHPTWSELVQTIKLPRSVDFAHAAASDVLQTHSQQAAKLGELRSLIAACLIL